MTGFTAETLDLSRLGAPSLVAADYDPLLAARLAKLAEIWAAAQIADPSLRDPELLIKSSIEVMLSEDHAFGDTLLRQSINDAADALRLGTAVGTDLRHLAQTYANTLPLVLDPGDPTATPPRAPLIEGDEELRARAQLAPEAFPEFGLTPGGYVYRVRRAFGDRVKGVRPVKRPGGRIDLYILARDGDGTPAPELIGDIQAAFEPEDASISTDIVTVHPARIVRYALDLVLLVKRGPDREAVKAAARTRLARLTGERHAIAANVPLHQIEAAALGSPAVAEDFVLRAPIADVLGGEDGAPWCTGISVEAEIAP